MGKYVYIYILKEELYTVPETNSSHLKMDGWKTTFLFWKAYVQVRTVSFREGSQHMFRDVKKMPTRFLMFRCIFPFSISGMEIKTLGPPSLPIHCVNWHI